jgi:hypothetical protein
LQKSFDSYSKLMNTEIVCQFWRQHAIGVNIPNHPSTKEHVAVAALEGVPWCIVELHFRDTV